MASLPPIEQSAERSPTKNGGLAPEALEEAKSPGRLENRRPAATRQNEPPSDNFDAYPPVTVSTLPRRRHRPRGGGLRGGGTPPSLIHGLEATRRFFLDEDKSLREGYIPNYRCISSLPLVQTSMVDPCLSGTGPS